MNRKLAALISDYQAHVKSAVALLQESGIPMPASDTDWAFNGIEQTGTLVDGSPYFKHGYGCMVRLSSGRAVDFDFGEQGQFDGFDAGRLAHFAGLKLVDYGFADEHSLDKCLKWELTSGSLTHSGYLLYYVANAA